MKIVFNEIEEAVLPQFQGGEKEFKTRMFADQYNKIQRGRLEPGASIGMHTHDTSSEIIYILEGNGTVLFDEGRESVKAGECHYCPKGHAHSLINSGDKELVFFAVVPQQ
ncbi:cupin domain-containing protein [Lacrimispora sp. JR3]|uniref:cupin domain-containing protein n=1 Tax=Lacrimispora sinapis TaxID=3111456 RepID=UPI0037494E70